MCEDKECSGFDLTAAFLLGGMIGAGLALLFAPASGKETRQKIRETGDRVRTRIREGTEEWRDSVSESVEQAKEGVKSFVGDAAVRGKAAVSAAKEAWQKPPEEEGKPAK